MTEPASASAPAPAPASGKPPLLLQAFAWDCLDYSFERDGRTVYTNAIFGHCHDRDSNVVVLRVPGRPVTGYFELPTTAPGGVEIHWTESQLGQMLGGFLESATFTYDSGKTGPVPRPKSWRLAWLKRVYGYRPDEERFPYLEAHFDTDGHLRNFTKAVTQEPVTYRGVPMAIRREEQGISHVRRFLTDNSLRYTQWFAVDEYAEPREPSSDETEYVCREGAIKPIDESVSSSWQVNPSILAFDIETHSSRGNSMPRPQLINDETTMISTTFRRDGEDPAKAERTVFVNGESYPIPGARVVNCVSELATILSFFKYLREKDPTVITGYNIFGYDFDYINRRINTFYKGEWPYLGRLVNLGRSQRYQFRVDEWESRSGGRHSNRYMQMDGRVLLDMLPEAKKSILPKMATYKLEAVSKRLLGTTKRQVDHRQSFRDRDRYLRAYNELLRCVGPALFKKIVAIGAATYASEVPGGIPDGITEADLVKIAPKTLAAMLKEAGASAASRVGRAITEYHIACLLLTKEAEYNVVDSVLVDRIFDKLMAWVVGTRFSYVMGISLTELQIKGQQIRCISQVYDLAHPEGYIINVREKTAMMFKGGLVQDPLVGIWHNILCFDFSGMYPSIMISANISPDTWVMPGREAGEGQVTTFDLTEQDFKMDDGSEAAALKGKSKAFTEKERKNKKSRGTKMSAAKTPLPAPPAAQDGQEAATTTPLAPAPLRATVRFVKPEIRKGLIPRVAQRLVEERRDVRKKQASFPKGSFEWNLYEQWQLAIKVVANSLYGFMGVREGRLPFVEGAACVTRRGREMITMVRRYLEDKYKATIIYGDTDSVMVVIPGLTGTAAMKKRGPEIAEEITKVLFGAYPAIKLEFEKGMDLMLIVTKKKYASTMTGMEPTQDNMLIRGMNIVKRGYTRWIQGFTRELLFRIILGATAAEAIRIIFDYARGLLGEGPKKASVEDLTVIAEYNGPYSGTYFLGTFANKLQRRGQEINPGDQIDSVITINPDEASPDPQVAKEARKKGNKMELLSDYLASQDTETPMQLDFLNYLEKEAQTPVDQLFGIAYVAQAEMLGKVTARFGRGRKARTAVTPIKLIMEHLREMGRGVTKEELLDRLGQVEAAILDRLAEGSKEGVEVDGKKNESTKRTSLPLAPGVVFV